MQARTILRATVVIVGLAAAAAVAVPRPTAASLPGDDQSIVHLLDRAAFGPRPGDVERVRQMGVEAYIDEQLHPERIPDAGMDGRLADFQTINLSSREIAQRYAIPLEQARRQLQQAKAKGGQDSQTPPQPPLEIRQQANRVLVELAAQKIERAVYSQRQLQEVLVDFWFNHFNVDARKGPDRFLLTAYERDVIRPHVLGSFRDLLDATAKSPAMLFYLDNWMSVDPNAASRPTPARGRFGFFRPPPPPQNQNPRRGLNENYGRELMELHTLGVDGGYTQKDVTEVARAFTGWTIDQPRMGGGFRFVPRLHDDGVKVVLGHRIHAGGERDGEEVLDILASSPATAHHIATELVQHFVSDDPPASLIDRVAKRFLDTHGDLREVMRTILTSPEFVAPAAYRAKVKTPFEFVVSAIRATNEDITRPAILVRTMQQLGEPLYQCQPPTGYKDTAEVWVNTGALVNRMNVALQLTGGRQSPVAPDPAAPPRADAIITEALAGDVSATTRQTIDKGTTEAQRLALTLGSPEFQRR